MKGLLILVLLTLVFLSGCLEKSQIFQNKGSEVLNQQACAEICDNLSDVANQKEIQCDQNGNCICKCSTKIW